nr:hypothetical protein CFP56_02546 [Quercus suber]
MILNRTTQAGTKKPVPVGRIAPVRTIAVALPSQLPPRRIALPFRANGKHDFMIYKALACGSCGSTAQRDDRVPDPHAAVRLILCAGAGTVYAMLALMNRQDTRRTHRPRLSHDWLCFARAHSNKLQLGWVPGLTSPRFIVFNTKVRRPLHRLHYQEKSLELHWCWTSIYDEETADWIVTLDADVFGVYGYV